MRDDEKQFFIEVLKAHKFKSYADSNSEIVVDIADKLGIGLNRRYYLLKKWRIKHFWDYNVQYTLYTGWFILDKLKGQYKDVYEEEYNKYKGEIIMSNNENTKKIIYNGNTFTEFNHDKPRKYVENKPYVNDTGIYVPVHPYTEEGISTAYKCIITKEMFVEAYNRYIKNSDNKTEVEEPEC